MKSKYRIQANSFRGDGGSHHLIHVHFTADVYASEEPKTAEPPAYESVKDLLDEEEVVKANDLELEAGQEFDVSSDRTNLEIKDESKVKVTFQKAENDAGRVSAPAMRILTMPFTMWSQSTRTIRLSDRKKADRKRACDSGSE